MGAIGVSLDSVVLLQESRVVGAHYGAVGAGCVCGRSGGFVLYGICTGGFMMILVGCGICA